MQLIALVYPDPVTARLAMDELESYSRDFVIRRDEIAGIIRDEAGGFKTITSAVIGGEQPPWGLFWEWLFAMLFFIPMLDMPIGSDLAPVLEEFERSGVRAAIDASFEERLRKEVAPGTSALFVLVDKVSVDEVVGALDPFGGTVLETHIPRDTATALRRAFHGSNHVD
jgi:uncharacterized membrane protein